MDWVKKFIEVITKIRRLVGRPWRTWVDNVEAYMTELGMTSITGGNGEIML